jgi:predicted N-acyltransferase
MKFVKHNNMVPVSGTVVTLHEVTVRDEDHEKRGYVNRWHNNQLVYHLKNGGFITFDEMAELLANKTRIGQMLPRYKEKEKECPKPPPLPTSTKTMSLPC